MQGNFIGTDATGTRPLPNAVHGVNINGGGTNNNTIGGNSPAARNLISGNTQAGVAIGNTSGNKVQGNYIGTDAAGTAALGNRTYGVAVGGAANALIGGALPGEGNVISSNLFGGIEIVADNIIVQGNLIGTQADGTSPLGNPQHGVRVGGANNLIGGRAAGAGNIIAFSRSGSVDFGSAVIVTHGINTTIVGNSIHSNDGLGIDLGRNWLTANDACDPDSDGSSNGLQNYPVLNSAASGGGATTVQGTLDSKPGATYTLDFYSNASCDAFGFGEGRTYLGSATVTTDPNCNASFTATLPVAVPAGQVLTATATDPSGSTSEFSACVAVTLINSAPDAVNDAATTNEDTPVVVNVLANDTDADGDTLAVGSFTQGANGAVTSNPNGTLTYTPNAGFSGADSFTYTITDGNGGTDSATVSVTVNRVSSPPDAVDDSATTDEDRNVTINARANDADGNCGAVSVSDFTQGANGSVALVSPNGTFGYFPTAHFHGADSFTYTLRCAGGDTDTATVTVTVNPVNDVPDARDDSYATDEDTPLTLAAPGVLANDTDPDGDALSAARVSGPTRGTLALNPDGSFTYTRGANFSGCDSFDYHARDGSNSFSNVATVTISEQSASGPSASGALASTQNSLSAFASDSESKIKGADAAGSFFSLTSKDAALSPLAARGSSTAAPSWVRAANLGSARVFHTATLLRDGKVLVVGGTANAVKDFFTGKTFLKSAELYDPATGAWRRTGDLGTARAHHTAMLLYDNRVLVAGGMHAAATLNKAELYDPLDSRQLFSTCAGVTVTAVHGEGFYGNSRIARIENGKVPCMHAETGEVRECLFETGGVSAGLMWVEAVDGQYAKTGQAITPQGEPNGEWIVAARLNPDGTVPCVAPSGRDTLGSVLEGYTLSQTCVIEDPLTDYNALSIVYPYWAPIFNYATREVCALPLTDWYCPHYDCAEVTRTINTCRGTVYCFTGYSAALNDINGAERDEYDTYYIGESQCHFLRNGQYEVPAAKRPATRSFPAPSVDIYSYILWRPVNPRVYIANDRYNPPPLP